MPWPGAPLFPHPRGKFPGKFDCGLAGETLFKNMPKINLTGRTDLAEDMREALIEAYSKDGNDMLDSMTAAFGEFRTRGVETLTLDEVLECIAVARGGAGELQVIPFPDKP